jgi:hypothetical protein
MVPWPAVSICCEFAERVAQAATLKVLWLPDGPVDQGWAWPFGGVPVAIAVATCVA